MGFVIYSKEVFYNLMEGFCPLASGSKGNSLFLGGKNTRILIDAGTSGAILEKRLLEIGVSFDTIDAILITHDHSDHIAALPSVLKKRSIPILANAETAKAIVAATSLQARFQIFTTGEPFVFKDFEIDPFSIPHDTLDPVAFTIAFEKRKLGVCTDLGYVTSLVQKKLQGCDCLLVEANHEVSQVHASNRPGYLKRRILGRQGHLSNEECANLLQSLLHPQLKQIYLAHLSGECNSVESALKAVQETVLHSVPVAIAYQDQISERFLFDE